MCPCIVGVAQMVLFGFDLTRLMFVLDVDSLALAGDSSCAYIDVLIAGRYGRSSIDEYCI